MNEDKVSEFKIVPITNLFVGCSKQVRNLHQRPMAASDNCNSHATSGVVEPDSQSIWWRCPEHEGLLNNGEEGAVVGGVLREVK